MKQTDQSEFSPSLVFPEILRQEYAKCSKEMRNCSYYGAVFALKDLFECILKLYVLCAAVKIQQTDGLEEILRLLCNPEKQPSMGTWLSELLPVCAEALEQEPAWKSSCGVLRKYYQKWNLVKWRNDTIGHGALRLCSDREFIEETEEKFCQLQMLLQKLEPYAADLGFDLENAPMPYFWQRPEGLCFLDGTVRGKGVWLCYANGKRYVQESVQVTGLLKRYYEALPVAGTESICEVIYPGQTDAALDAYYKENDYCKALYMRDWLQSCIAAHEKGVFLLSADRGCGKSAFSYAMDQLGGNQLKIPQVACRTYFCNRSSLRSIEDFVMQLSHSFYRTTDGIDWRSWQEEGMKGLSLKEEDRQQALCRCLASCLRFQQKQGYTKLLLIIDGVDELTPENQALFTFLPKPQLLPAHVYLLLTVRQDDAPGGRIQRLLQQLTLTEQICFNRRAENAALLKQAVMKVSPMPLSEEQLCRIMEILDYRFHGLRVFQTMAEANLTERFLQENPRDSIAHYIQLLRSCYGSYDTALNTMLCVLAVAEVPMDMQVLALLAGNERLQTGTLAVLYDLKPLCSAEHSREGGLYLWRYSEELREMLLQDSTLLLHLAEKWKEMLERLEVVFPQQRSGYFYMATHFLQLWKMAQPEGKELTEELLFRVLSLIQSLNAGQIQYMETLWQLNALSDIEAAAEKMGDAAIPLLFTALVKMLHPLWGLKQLKRAIQIIEKAEQVLSRHRELLEEQQLPMIWQYYSGSMILYAETGNADSAEQQYQAAMRLPEAAGSHYAKMLRINHINMIKQSDPARCLEECESLLAGMGQQEEADQLGLLYSMAIACDQLAQDKETVRAGRAESYILREKQYLEQGVSLGEATPLASQNLARNRSHALLLEGLGRWYVKWGNDLDRAIECLEKAEQIDAFHNSLQNLIPPEDTFRIQLFLIRWYLERGRKEDLQRARERFAKLDYQFNHLTVELSQLHQERIREGVETLREELAGRQAYRDHQSV